MLRTGNGGPRAARLQAGQRLGPAFAALQGRRGTAGWLLAISAAQRATFAVTPSPTAFAAIFPSTITGDMIEYGRLMAAAVKDMAVQVWYLPPPPPRARGGRRPQPVRPSRAARPRARACVYGYAHRRRHPTSPAVPSAPRAGRPTAGQVRARCAFIPTRLGARSTRGTVAARPRRRTAGALPRADRRAAGPTGGLRGAQIDIIKGRQLLRQARLSLTRSGGACSGAPPAPGGGGRPRGGGGPALPAPPRRPSQVPASTASRNL